ncbi:MAG: hypothetical protein KAY13_01110 [Zoogloea sp.]|nr:hypothetical protein [Zoogloea sp.]
MAKPPDLPRDLTRWNRAGLSRVTYVDGNAAVFLERMRARLAASFPAWPATLEETGDGLEALDTRQKMEGLYARDPDDVLWHLTRAYARATHVLASSLDATANEGWIGTATQWESLRRLTAMLDYAPHPPASAFTELPLKLKPGLAGKVKKGFQVRYSPTDGSKPVIFETLEDLDGDASLNALRPRDFDRNPKLLSGARIELAGRFDKLKTGDPLVLENEIDGRLAAHLIVGVGLGETTTTVDLSPPVSRGDGFTRGHTLFHLNPKDRLTPIAPLTTGASVAKGLRLTAPPPDLRPGEVVFIGRGTGKPVFRRVKDVRNETLAFHAALGEIDLANATVMRPQRVPIAHLSGSARLLDNNVDSLTVLYVAGDWGWLSGRWLGDIRHENGQEYLPLYECIKANYFPPTATQNDQANPLAGYTALTLHWNTGDNPPDADLSPTNPQALFTAPRAAGPWQPDTFLRAGNGGGREGNKLYPDTLAEPLTVSQPKRAAPGDIAVVARGGILAWARLKHVSVNGETGTAELQSNNGWWSRQPGIFYTTVTRVHAHFSETARCTDAGDNVTRFFSKGSGRTLTTRIPLPTLPAALRNGRRVLLHNGSATLATRVDKTSTAGEAPWIDVVGYVPAGSTLGNLILSANVVLAGHGESKPVLALGSGNGALNSQRFLLDASDVSFVPDASMPGGVRADVTVSVGGEIWPQVANLGSSGPSEAHYQVRQNEEGKLWIEFGDGRHGRRLPTGANNVLVSYRQGVGSAGNLPAGLLTQPVHPHALVAGLSQPGASAGGGEREGPESLRKNAAGALLALERAVSLSDFAALARGNAGIAQAEAFALPSGRSRSERVELVVVPAGDTGFPDTSRDKLGAYLLAHALPGVSLTISPYTEVNFSVEITIRVRPEAFDKEEVKAAVRAALIRQFSIKQRALGQVLHRGELYAVVEAVQGVENSDVVMQVPSVDGYPRLTPDSAGVLLAAYPLPRQAIHLSARSPAVIVNPEDYFL